MTYENILLANDGTAASMAAIDHAITMADAFDATLHVVYVRSGAEQPPGIEDPAEPPELKEKRQQILGEPKELAEQAGIDVTTVSIERKGGNVSDLLVRYAQTEEIDLIVLGTHGRSGFDRLIVGSVAESVVRDAPVPVVTVRPEADE